MPSEDFTLTLETTELPIETVPLVVSSSELSTGFILVEVYNKTNTLKYGTEYSVVGLTSSSVVAVVTAPSFSTPPEPIRITSAGCSLGEQQKSTIVLLKGVKLGGGLTFAVGVRKIEGSTLIGDEMEVNLLLKTLTKTVYLDAYKWTRFGCGLRFIEVLVDNTHGTAEFAVGEEQTSKQLKHGEEYTLKGSWTETKGFLVEDGITVVVPLTPKVTQLKFSFSNTLHTGCLVTLTGTDLIVGESLNVTLNDSLSFITTVPSETEARSTELQIGWPTTLQHDTKYTVTSIEAKNSDGGKTLFDSAVSDTTGSHVRPFVIYIDSGPSSDSSLFCGDFDRPCTSIEDGWKIVEGIEISSMSISILRNTTQKEQVKILSHHEVVIESGPSTSPELFVSPSSLSELKGDGMVDVSGGRLWLHEVDVVLSDSPSLVFIRMVGGHLTIKTCSLVGTKRGPTINIDSGTDLCEWDTGILKLEGATTNITSTQLSHLSQGEVRRTMNEMIVNESQKKRKSHMTTKMIKWLTKSKTSDERSGADIFSSIHFTIPTVPFRVKNAWRSANQETTTIVRIEGSSFITDKNYTLTLSGKPSTDPDSLDVHNTLVSVVAFSPTEAESIPLPVSTTSEFSLLFGYKYTITAITDGSEAGIVVGTPYFTTRVAPSLPTLKSLSCKLKTGNPKKA
ncbi:hypothetical protein BLNAU_14696 [Blattamonas nauphoetae]|uniref:IPT/TIG domain-containing protein n=1 Tax=Blattamonas nauphoetae TaxID=2049346 RepID=A0ABQ9XCY1_9EUKA|nr:hypothetical protein BLNAU_14696 [Blattamonas nauphoetae]